MTETPSPPTRDLCAFALCAAILALSLVIGLDEEGCSIPGPNGAIRLPDTCLFRQLSGMPCPSCGLMRSFVAMSHQDLTAAWRFNPVGPLFYALVVLQLPYRAVRLAWPGFRRRTQRLDDWLTLGALFCILFLLIVNWLLHL